MIRAIVTDIEGTTSSLSFVQDVLFPYAREHIADYIRIHQQEPFVLEQLAEVRKITHQPNWSVEEIIAQLIQWLDQDQKITPLKAIQGLVWEKGYREGDYQGHLYPDAVEQLRIWHQQDLDLYVYSSGSVYAQKLLFSHTPWGDLTPLFQGYFDTTIGAKIESLSYQRIASSLALPPQLILFLSDVKMELDAATQAGWQTRWLVRDGQINPNASHQQVQNFHLIEFD
jgi:enolase-phosphatase E1